MIDFKDFQKLEIKIAKVLEAERIKGSDKLIKLKIDLGQENRQIIAGIGKFYTPEEMIGKEIVVLTNLEPRVLMGNESRGMLLAANKDGEPILLMPDKEVPAGTKIT